LEELNNSYIKKVEEYKNWKQKRKNLEKRIEDYLRKYLTPNDIRSSEFDFLEDVYMENCTNKSLEQYCIILEQKIQSKYNPFVNEINENINEINKLLAELKQPAIKKIVINFNFQQLSSESINKAIEELIKNKTYYNNILKRVKNEYNRRMSELLAQIKSKQNQIRKAINEYNQYVVSLNVTNVEMEEYTLSLKPTSIPDAHQIIDDLDLKLIDVNEKHHNIQLHIRNKLNEINDRIDDKHKILSSKIDEYNKYIDYLDIKNATYKKHIPLPVCSDICKEHEILEYLEKNIQNISKSIEKFSKEYAEKFNNLEKYDKKAAKIEKVFYFILSKEKDNSFNQYTNKLREQFQSDDFCGTVEYDKAQIYMLQKEGGVDMEHLLHKGPNHILESCPNQKPIVEKFITNIKSKYKTHNADIVFIPIGGCGEIGGNCFLLKYQGYNYLIDIGKRPLKGSFGNPDITMLSQYGIPDLNHLDGILITHAHNDHIGALFDLIILKGIDVPVYMTKASYEIFLSVMADQIKFIEDDIFIRGNCTKEEWRKRFLNFDLPHNIENIVSPWKPFNLVDGEIVVTPLHAGHILGAVGYLFEFLTAGKRILFTGDFTLKDLKSIKGCDFLNIGKVDSIICEGTYLGKMNSRLWKSPRVLARKIDNVIQKGGIVVIPSFSLGKSQEILASLYEYQQDLNLSFNIKTDGLVHRICKIYRDYIPSFREYFERSNNGKAVQCIIASSGTMRENTAVSKYLIKALPDTKSMIIKGSYFDEEYSGWAANYQLIKGHNIRYDNHTIKINATLEDYRLPMHAQKHDIEQVLTVLNPEKVFIVHCNGYQKQNYLPLFSKSTEVIFPKNFYSYALS